MLTQPGLGHQDSIKPSIRAGWTGPARTPPGVVSCPRASSSGLILGHTVADGRGRSWVVGGRTVFLSPPTLGVAREGRPAVRGVEQPSGAPGILAVGEPRLGRRRLGRCGALRAPLTTRRQTSPEGSGGDTRSGRDLPIRSARSACSRPPATTVRARRACATADLRRATRQLEGQGLFVGQDALGFRLSSTVCRRGRWRVRHLWGLSYLRRTSGTGHESPGG